MIKSILKSITPPIITDAYRKLKNSNSSQHKDPNEPVMSTPGVTSLEANMPTNIEIINCPYCNSNVATTYRNRADIVKCGSCSLVYLRTRPTREALYQIYQDYANDTSHMRLPGSHAEIISNPLRRNAFVNEVIGFTTAKSGSWLDIGCGWGALLMNAREHGFSPIGIEMTRNCLDYAATQLQIPVSNSQFTDSAIGESSCQVISMVHVLEHIPNPKETLDKIFRTLVPGGSFCGIVPNIESYCSDLQKENWEWLDETHHYVHYSPTTLREKLEQAGFVIQKIYTAVGDYGEYFVNIIRKEFPTKSDRELEQIQQELEQAGKGDEIRFFVTKP